MTNRNLAFWLFATCNFAQCDAGKRSAAEAAVLNPNGGAIGILAATRTVFASPNTNLNRAVCDTLFGHSNVFHYDNTVCEAVAAAKKKLGNEQRKVITTALAECAERAACGRASD